MKASALMKTATEIWKFADSFFSIRRAHVSFQQCLINQCTFTYLLKRIWFTFGKIFAEMTVSGEPYPTWNLRNGRISRVLFLNFHRLYNNCYSNYLISGCCVAVAARMSHI